MKMRAFIAIPCPDELKEPMVKVQQEIRGFGKMKLVDRANIHLTLKFLGEVDDDKVGSLRDELNFLTATPKFDISLAGVGVFPKPDYVRVVWIGVRGGSDSIINIQQQTDSALKSLGFKKEKKFHPHFTIARVKYLDRKHELVDFLDLNRDLEFGSFTVDKIHLMKSQLTPQGPIYSVIEEFCLG